MLGAFIGNPLVGCEVGSVIGIADGTVDGTEGLDSCEIVCEFKVECTVKGVDP